MLPNIIYYNLFLPSFETILSFGYMLVMLSSLDCKILHVNDHELHQAQRNKISTVRQSIWIQMFPFWFLFICTVINDIVIIIGIIVIKLVKSIDDLYY